MTKRWPGASFSKSRDGADKIAEKLRSAGKQVNVKKLRNGKYVVY